MKPICRYLVCAVAVLAMAVAVVSIAPNSSAFAQTAAPSAPASLPTATIQALQEALNKQGIAVNADGVLRDDTRAAIRQYQSQHHLPVTGEPDQATLDKLGVPAQQSAAPGSSPPAATAVPGQAMGAPGMGGQGMMVMMTPEMMQMMQSMMGQRGTAEMMSGMADQVLPSMDDRAGMMSQGSMPPAGGTMVCRMMQAMMGARAGMGMSGIPSGPAMLYGMPQGAQEEMTPERVRTFLEQSLTRHNNPRLKLGEIATTEDGSITAEIVTVDGSLVQKLAFNRYPGLFRQVQ